MMKSAKYDDIINLPHPTSLKHPRMANMDRAAQFSPFAALTGHSDAIKETARLTEGRMELDEHEKAMLDEQMQVLLDNLPKQPQVTLTYFEPDEYKEGGAYLTIRGAVKKFDAYKKCVIFQDGTEITVEDIVKLEVLLNDV